MFGLFSSHQYYKHKKICLGDESNPNFGSYVDSAYTQKINKYYSINRFVKICNYRCNAMYFKSHFLNKSIAVRSKSTIILEINVEDA